MPAALEGIRVLEIAGYVTGPYAGMLLGADVLIENFRPGVADRLGFGYGKVRERNPRLVYCSITGFGPDGPYRDWPGYDTVGQAMSGLLGLLTDLDDPGAMGISLSDHLTGLFACYGILGALMARERTGEGQLVETSLLQASEWMRCSRILRCTTWGCARRSGGPR